MIFFKNLLHSVDLTLPDLPPALEGLRIVHLSDLHIHRRRLRHKLIAQHLKDLQVDMVFLTGDYLCGRGDEQIALEVMGELLGPLKPRLGTFGVFGNHDTNEARILFQSLPVDWLDDVSRRPQGLPLELLGFAWDDRRQPDSVAAMTHLLGSNGHDHATTPQGSRPVRILLSHKPTLLPTASDMDVDVMFSGHTHGGQMRLPGRRALTNSSDLPLHLTSGVLRHHDTLCVISRGLGESWLQMRLFCEPQIPLYTLRRGELPGSFTEQIENVQPW